MLKKFRLVLSVITIHFIAQSASGAIPRPDHIVICMMENHGYAQVMDSSIAPNIWNLAMNGANLRQFYSLTHPSQPNYILLYSGYNQGEVTDNMPPLTPWQTPNLGASLIQNGFTFKGYSEDLPAVGSTAFYSGSYARKHSPWVNWQGPGLNQLPDSVNVPFSDFPTDFNLLPDVSFVIPNQDNDMHNGVDPDRITIGDTWLATHLGDYITWAQTHNSLFILTFDEDNDAYQNHIPCIFYGPMVRTGQYSLNAYNLLDLLRTLEEIYGLQQHGHAKSAEPIEEIWLNISVPTVNQKKADVSPNPLVTQSSIRFINASEKSDDGYFILSNLEGKELIREQLFITPGTNTYTLKRGNLKSGFYFFSIQTPSTEIAVGKVVIN